MNKVKNINILGAGFSSLSAACYLASQGHQVTIFEKNKSIGGRARMWSKEDFHFDMGPTFYWMPDVFESFFNDFDKKTTDYYQLKRLDPAYKVYFGEDQSITIPAHIEKIKETFEEVEPGSSKALDKFIKNAEENYDIAVKDLVYQPGESIFEIVTPQTAKKLGLFFTSIQKQVRKHIKHPQLREILEFPVLFLGAKPSNTPAFYNFMNYADMVLGTWHPIGGMVKVAEAMAQLAEELGCTIITNAEVEEIKILDKKATGIVVNGKEYPADIIVSGADYAHTEQLLPAKLRQYKPTYWESKTFAPSALLFYVAFDKQLENVDHHTLFFDTDFETHAKAIYDTKEWPEDPLFYASFPSISDPNIAPVGKEAGIFLIPLAPGLEDTEEQREKQFNVIIDRLELLTKQKVRENIIFRKSYSVNDFVRDYHSYKGNAYGLANTLLQTHILRPKMRSKKVKNLYFTGQLTLPGPGVPPSIISGKIVSNMIKDHL